MTIELLRLAVDTFAVELDATDDDDFASPTKCEGWDVRELLAHVVSGTEATTAALQGASRDDILASFASFRLGPDPRAQFRDAVDAQIAAFEAAPDPSAIIHHPAMDMPVAQAMAFRIVDFTAHAWDLGAGLGRDVVLPPALCEFAWASLSPMAPMLAASGHFGSAASGEVADTADLQTKVLDLAGRRP